MYKIMNKKLSGLKEDLASFTHNLVDITLERGKEDKFVSLVYEQMKQLGFDQVTKDRVGNIVGIIHGYEPGPGLMLVSHREYGDSQSRKSTNLISFKAGIVSSLYAAGLVKRSLLPLGGDLLVCCVPREECCDFGIKYLFENQLKKKIKKLKGIILSEPTNFNLNLGHRGRIEYEIIVKGRLGYEFLEHRGINILGAMFPLINELEKVSHTMPTDYSLGTSSLKIKDVRYLGATSLEKQKEFRVVVDRMFVPEENIEGVLKKAKTIAKNIYKADSEIRVNTALARTSVKPMSGAQIVTEKKFKAWKMESNEPLVLESQEVLRDNHINSSLGYWKKIVTEGSYTFGEYKIPTIGFGAGSEDIIGTGQEVLSLKDIEKAVLGQALIVQRSIGMPAFGWREDEI